MITLAIAKTIIAGAQAEAAQKNFKPLSVVVLDKGAHVIAFEKQDGSSNKRFEIAFGKANGALALGMGSRALMARAESQAYFINAATSAIGGSLIPVPGGVLVKDSSGVVIGAVGISGDTSDNDETAAIAGIHSAGLSADPG
jgi:uncharacterized protein GlcG (DUF336 family)